MRLLLVFVSFFMLLSCQDKNIIETFDALSNYPQMDTVKVDMSLDNSVFNGIVLPKKEEYFVFKARVDNPNNEQLYYKIYYQNESYKFSEERIEANENFYGSWEDTQVGFKPFNGEVIIDSFQIVGNPRNESKYFGKKPPRQLTYKDIEEGIRLVKEKKEWYESIKEKAKRNKIPIEEQIVSDIVWQINYENNKQGEINRRERRNPRTGVYEFMLVVADKEGLNAVAQHIKDISKRNPQTNDFENPFSYFKNNSMKGVYVLRSQKVLKTKAVLNAEKGIFVNTFNCPSTDFKVYSHDTSLVGNSEYLYKNSLFEQYFHDINKNKSISQIPLIANLQQKGDYTLLDYEQAKEKYKNRLKIYPTNTFQPGKNIYIPQDKSYIGIKNPANSDLSTARKENVGIKTRIGLTYGKYRGKIKFPSLVNPDGVWTGLTNAFWLAFQSDSDWNKRRACKNKGYVKHSKNDNESEREETSHYSEIDIEMIKTSKYWTEEELEKDNPKGNGKFVLACTNWDLSCPQPVSFHTGGIQTIKYKGNRFQLHRWSETYRALTSRVELDNDIFDNDFYYFEIEWKPTEIIWRIGKDENNMKVVGYMNEDVTSIPNNQMIAIVTQEFHYSDWWLPEVFEQGLIPFSSKAFEGKVFEIVIE